MNSGRFWVPGAIVVLAAGATLVGACADASDRPATVTSGPDVEDVRDVELKRIAALVDGDVEAARQALGDDFELVDPTGSVEDAATYLASVSDGTLDYETWAPESDLHVRASGDVAVVRYRSRIDVAYRGEPIRGRFWLTEYYERRAGAWQLVWSQATPIT